MNSGVLHSCGLVTCSLAGFLLGCRSGPQPVGHGGIGVEVDHDPLGRARVGGLAPQSFGLRERGR